MAGKIKKAIDEIVLQRSKGNATLASTTRTKLMIKGINLEIYREDTPDDPAMMEKIHQIAKELGVSISI